MRPEDIGGSRGGGVADFGIGGLHAGRIGKGNGRDITTLSSAVKRLQIRARKDVRLAATVKALFKAVF
jgi:hypothetical protein